MAFPDFARATITRDSFIMGPMRPGVGPKSQLNKQVKHTQFDNFATANYLCRALEAGCRVVSIKLHLTLNKAHRAHVFPQLEIRKKKRDKAGKRDGAKKRELTPERGNVDTYAVIFHHPSVERKSKKTNNTSTR